MFNVNAIKILAANLKFPALLNVELSTTMVLSDEILSTEYVFLFSAHAKVIFNMSK